MNTYQEFVESVASTVSYFDLSGLPNAVFEAVCSAGIEDLNAHLELSDDWTETGHVNDWWAQRNAPDFADCTALGDWEGFDLESVQEFCQDVLAFVVTRDHL